MGIMIKRSEIARSAIAVTLTAVAVCAGVVAAHVGSDEPDKPNEFVIYEEPALYWVFSHRDTLCETAERTISHGLDESDAIYEAVGALPPEADTADAATYLRGMLRGCLAG